MQVVNRSDRWAEIVRGRLQALLQTGVAVYTVSRAAGISHTSLVHFLENRRDLGLGLFEKLATYLGMDIVIKNDLPVIEVTRKPDKRVQGRLAPPGGGG